MGILDDILNDTLVLFCAFYSILYLYCCCILVHILYTPEYTIYSCGYTTLYGMHYFMHGCDIIT